MYIVKTMAKIEDMHDFLELFQGPEIDAVEGELARLHHGDLSARLNKLSIDAGIDYMRLKTGGFDPESGPGTARLSRGYEPVTVERLAVLDEIRALLPGHETLRTLCEALGHLRAVIPASPAAARPEDYNI